LLFGLLCSGFTCGHRTPIASRPIAAIVGDSQSSKLHNREVESLFSDVADFLTSRGFHEHDRRYAGGYTLSGSRFYSDTFSHTNGIWCFVELDRKSVSVHFSVFETRPGSGIFPVSDEQRDFAHVLTGEVESFLRKRLPSSYEIDVSFHDHDA